MYKINDQVVYGKSGVCKITDIATPKNLDISPYQLYYVLQPCYEDCKIYTPVNTTVFMRPVISAEEAERLIDLIPTMRAEAYYSDFLQELTQHYEEAVKEYTCADLIELTMSLYHKKQAALRNNRKFAQVDQKYLKQAEDLLFGELAIALGIRKDKVQEYIAARVEVNQGRRKADESEGTASDQY